MKCPLYFIGRTAVIPREGAHIGDCLKEECAWWDRADTQCGILTGMLAIEGVWANLRLIKEDMPHAGQFTT